MDTFISFMLLFLAGSASYYLVSTAGLFSEKSGTVNIALEGTMIMGLLAYYLVLSQGFDSNNLDNNMPVFILNLLGWLAAIAIGMLYMMLLAYPTIKYMSNHVITGTALNILAPALSILILHGMGENNLSVNSLVFGAETNGFIWMFLGFFVIAAAILFISWYVINRTNFGLRLRAAGENPHSLESAGVSVSKTRYQSLAIAGALAGLGGAFAIALFPLFEGAVNGMGYIALAILITGNWTIKGNIMWSTLFAVLVSLTRQYDLLSWLQFVPEEIISMIPFIIPVVALVFVKDSKAPTSAGIPYNKETH